MDLGGEPLIVHVCRRAAAADLVDAVIVATDDERVAAAVAAAGFDVRLTSAAHASGTDRIAEVAAALPCRAVVNVQGDEPLIEPAAIDAAVAALLADPDAEMATLGQPIDDPAELGSPHVVKVVCDLRGRALYFSRSPIPFVREAAADRAGAARPLAHVGLYVYRRQTLLRLAALSPSPLERAESLEQLRALEHGIPILVIETSSRTRAVDTADDLAWVRAHWPAAPAARAVP